jgi:hypothetical protein
MNAAAHPTYGPDNPPTVPPPHPPPTPNLQAGVLAEDKLFATLDPTTRKVRPAGRQRHGLHLSPQLLAPRRAV